MNDQNNYPTPRKNILSDFFDLYAREFFNPMIGEENAETFSPRVDVKETATGYSVRAELPGVDEKDINLSLDDNCLILQGEKKTESSSEFSYGSFYRTIPLRADVDDNKIEATYRNGILTVNLVKKEDGTEKSKKIKINH